MSGLGGWVFIVEDTFSLSEDGDVGLENCFGSMTDSRGSFFLCLFDKI